MPVFKNTLDLQLRKNIRAFLSLEAGIGRGVAARKDGSPQRSSDKERQIARLQEELARANAELDRLKTAGPTSGRPDADTSAQVPIFFVVGAPKSGTTWLRLMLDDHPEILCQGEGKFFGREDRDENIARLGTNMKGRRVRPASLYNALAEDEYLRLWMERTFWSRDVDVEEHMARLTAEAVRYFLTRKLAGTDKKIVGDKTPLQNAKIVGEIGKIMPEARIIHIVRDGRDQAISHAHHRWNFVRPVEEGGKLLTEEQGKRDRYRADPQGFLASGESIFMEERLNSAARGWRSNVGHARDHGRTLFGERYAEVRYEDLLEDPEREMAQLFRFLGAGAHKEVVRSIVEKHSFEKKTGRASGEEVSTNFLRKGVAGDWREVFTGRDRRIYEEAAGDLLAELGYERDGG